MAGNGFSLEDRVAVVTGGGQSLGLAICRALRAAGASIVVAEINDETGPDAAEELRGYLRQDRRNRPRIGKGDGAARSSKSTAV